MLAPVYTTYRLHHMHVYTLHPYTGAPEVIVGGGYSSEYSVPLHLRSLGVGVLHVIVVGDQSNWHQNF